MLHRRSLDAPKSFHDLESTIHGTPAFALGFAFLLLIWYKHYRYFREFGLQDTKTIVLNALLQRRGADIAMVTTLGFRDHIEVGDTRRYTGGLFDHRWRREQTMALPQLEWPAASSPLA